MGAENFFSDPENHMQTGNRPERDEVPTDPFNKNRQFAKDELIFWAGEEVDVFVCEVALDYFKILTNNGFMDH